MSKSVFCECHSYLDEVLHSPDMQRRSAGLSRHMQRIHIQVTYTLFRRKVHRNQRLLSVYVMKMNDQPDLACAPIASGLLVRGKRYCQRSPLIPPHSLHPNYSSPSSSSSPFSLTTLESLTTFSTIIDMPPRIIVVGAGRKHSSIQMLIKG